MCERKAFPHKVCPDRNRIWLRVNKIGVQFSSVQFYLTFTSYITNLQKLFIQIQYILVKIDLMKTEYQSENFDSFDKVSFIYGGAPNLVSPPPKKKRKHFFKIILQSFLFIFIYLP